MKCSQSRGVTPPTLMCLPRRISWPTSVDRDRVINVVIGCVGGRDILESKLCHKADDAGCFIRSLVHRPEFADESVDDDQRGIEHGNPPNFLSVCVAAATVLEYFNARAEMLRRIVILVD
jgi:hypothetical protein